MEDDTQIVVISRCGILTGWRAVAAVALAIGTIAAIFMIIHVLAVFCVIAAVLGAAILAALIWALV